MHNIIVTEESTCMFVYPGGHTVELGFVCDHQPCDQCVYT